MSGSLGSRFVSISFRFWVHVWFVIRVRVRFVVGNIWARVGCVSGTCLFVSFRVSFGFVSGFGSVRVLFVFGFVSGFISGSRLEFVDSSSVLVYLDI